MPVVAGRILAPPPRHGTTPVWNAGFIWQVGKLQVLLPDESGVPVVV